MNFDCFKNMKYEMFSTYRLSNLMNFYAERGRVGNSRARKTSDGQASPTWISFGWHRFLAEASVVP